MEPVTQARLTKAVTVASEVANGIAGQAGKSTWSRIKFLFNWSPDQGKADLSAYVRKRIYHS